MPNPERRALYLVAARHNSHAKVYICGRKLFVYRRTKRNMTYEVAVSTTSRESWRPVSLSAGRMPLRRNHIKKGEASLATECLLSTDVLGGISTE